ncbi:alpha/beta hydrolase [Cellulomonas sp. ATA003]|uniref:alpha/beta hydrolase family protein n=1 Tax=Cellulomonas sp. ATA003 TaxID=3073064 RepID=UPI0028731563|nr:alpha/beta hydrolase [Cellulomonas sp. ATA003]WNB86565.1 alpha/beta hydrolase [Cellulomonas sp. ATA003]
MTPDAATGHASRHVTVLVAPDELPDAAASLEVLDAALDARGLTGELVLTGSPDELRDAIAAATARGHEPVVVPGVATDLGPLAADVAAPVLRLDLDGRPRDQAPAVRRHLRGRGLDGLRYAVDAWWAHHTHPPALTHRYGPDRDQVADLHLPTTPPGPDGHPVAVLVHGGYWRSRWESDLMEPLALDLTARGWATWNVEYRRPDDHGWAATTDDVAAALAALADVDEHADGAAPLDLARVVTLGHSAGGQLAIRLAADVAADVTTDHAPHVRPALTVSLAGVLDLVAGDRLGLGGGAVAAALGARPEDAPDLYRASSPLSRVPVGLPLAVVCGLDDDPHLLAMARAFATQARAAGDDVVTVEGPGDHFAVVDPRSRLWRAVLDVLEPLAP